jgi:hypothetical protein
VEILLGTMRSIERQGDVNKTYVPEFLLAIQDPN